MECFVMKWSSTMHDVNNGDGLSSIIGGLDYRHGVWQQGNTQGVSLSYRNDNYSAYLLSRARSIMLFPGHTHLDQVSFVGRKVAKLEMHHEKCAMLMDI